MTLQADIYRQDMEFIKMAKEHIEYYSGLYLRYLQINPEISALAKENIELLKEGINEALSRKSNPDKGMVKWC